MWTSGCGEVGFLASLMLVEVSEQVIFDVEEYRGNEVILIELADVRTM